MGDERAQEAQVNRRLVRADIVERRCSLCGSGVDPVIPWPATGGICAGCGRLVCSRCSAIPSAARARTVRCRECGAAAEVVPASAPEGGGSEVSSINRSDPEP
jgi:hypothetical protein